MFLVVRNLTVFTSQAISSENKLKVKRSSFLRQLVKNIKEQNIHCVKQKVYILNHGQLYIK